MKKIIGLSVAALLLMHFTLPETELTSKERAAALSHLQGTKKALLESIRGLSHAQLEFRPAPDAWSIAACVEHLALSEANLFKLQQSTLLEKADPGRRNEVKMSDEDLFNAISDRTQKVKTKEGFEPSGKFGSHEATANEFVAKRDNLINYVKTTSDDLRNHYFTLPFGTVDSFQLLIFIAGHTKRHTLQIEEIKNNPAFPEK